MQKHENLPIAGTLFGSGTLVILSVLLYYIRWRSPDIHGPFAASLKLLPIFGIVLVAWHSLIRLAPWNKKRVELTGATVYSEYPTDKSYFRWFVPLILSALGVIALTEILVFVT